MFCSSRRVRSIVDWGDDRSRFQIFNVAFREMVDAVGISYARLRYLRVLGIRSDDDRPGSSFRIGLDVRRRLDDSQRDSLRLTLRSSQMIFHGFFLSCGSLPPRLMNKCRS